MTKAEQAGEKANNEGKTLADNPYLFPICRKLHQEWKAGFINAQKKRKEIRPS
jgi:hypothetical protein